jgi:hypothetical protein
VEVSSCRSSDRARHHERYGLVGECPRLPRCNCLDLASNCRNPCGSPDKQHIRANGSECRNPRHSEAITRSSESKPWLPSIRPPVRNVKSTFISDMIVTTEEKRFVSRVFRSYDKVTEVSQHTQGGDSGNLRPHGAC